MAKKRTAKSKPKSKFEIHLDKCMAQVEKLGLSVERKQMHRVLLSLGPTIYNRDSATVATSDPKEVAYVKNNFMKKKLKMTDEGVIDEVFLKVKDDYRKGSTPQKFRAVFYVSIVLKLNLTISSIF